MPHTGLHTLYVLEDLRHYFFAPHSLLSFSGPISQYAVILSDQLSGPKAKNILPQCVYQILTQILRDKDRNGKNHNQIFEPDKKGHCKKGFSDRIKSAF